VVGEVVTGKGVPHDVMPPSDVCRSPDGLKSLLSVLRRQVASEFQPRSQVVSDRHQSPLSGLSFMTANVDTMLGYIIPIEPHSFFGANASKEAKC
tara:strand:- start:1242 stop:1526 length:285 start_codon:yes stop_codon:yes gene_type:complete